LACVKEWWDFGGLKKLRIIFHKRDDEIWGDANTWWRILSFVQVDLCDHDALEDVFNTFRYAAVETLYNFCLCMLQVGFTKFCWNSHTIFMHDATNWVRELLKILYNFPTCCKLGLENYSWESHGICGWCKLGLEIEGIDPPKESPLLLLAV
jgi:hypothetical protein